MDARSLPGTRNQPWPCRVGALRRKVSEIAAGAHFSVALMAAGSLYTWGAGDQGQLGHGVFAEGQACYLYHHTHGS